MKIEIGRMDDENIWTKRDYTDIKDKGEVAHIICELESIKLELLELWEEMNDKEE